MTKQVSLSAGGASTKFDLAVEIDGDESPRTLSNEWIAIGSDKSQTRFNAPVIWERTTTGYRITDLRHGDYISSALNLLEVTTARSSLAFVRRNYFHIPKLVHFYFQSNFFLQEPLCLSTSLSKDIDSSKFFRRFVRKCIIDGNGVCAIREGDGIVVGLAVLSERNKSEKENHDTQGDALIAILALENRLFDEKNVKNTIEELEKYLRIDVLFVSLGHRGKGVGTGLLRSCVAKSRSIGVSTAIIGSFSSNISQRIG